MPEPVGLCKGPSPEKDWLLKKGLLKEKDHGTEQETKVSQEESKEVQQEKN